MTGGKCREVDIKEMQLMYSLIWNSAQISSRFAVQVKLRKKRWRLGRRKLQFVLIKLHLTLQRTCRSMYSVTASQCNLNFIPESTLSISIKIYFLWKFDQFSFLVRIQCLLRRIYSINFYGTNLVRALVECIYGITSFATFSEFLK